MHYVRTIEINYKTMKKVLKELKVQLVLVKILNKKLVVFKRKNTTQITQTLCL
jgi:hypothetical protein